MRAPHPHPTAALGGRRSGARWRALQLPAVAQLTPPPLPLHPEQGTFVLRFGSKAGQLVMTVRNSQGKVDHVLLSQTRLHSEGLQVRCRCRSKGLGGVIGAGPGGLELGWSV